MAAWSADIKALVFFKFSSESESFESSVAVLSESDCDSSNVPASAETKLATSSFLRALCWCTFLCLKLGAFGENLELKLVRLSREPLEL